MERSRNRMVLVTCGKLSEARRIARAAVKGRLAACVNIVLNPVESTYRWKNSVEVSREFLLVIKTGAARLPELERLVHRLHSYEVPEFVVLHIASGSAAYLRWLNESVTPGQLRRRQK
jgi:periplasmic divalent cation tolerance protein